MRLPLFDLANTSQIPTGTTLPNPTVPSGYTLNALPASYNVDFVPYPRTDSIFRSIYDVSASTAVTPMGGLLELWLNGPNIGGAWWSANRTANYPYIQNTFGIVNAPAQATGSTTVGKASIVIHGIVNALIQPSATTTINPGSLLTSDGAGHLQLGAGTPASNIVLAIAMTTVSTNASSTLLSLSQVYVQKGG